jgi:hypothetical protein
VYFSLEKGSLVISKQPQPAECSFGDSVSFEIEAESFELLSYQWYKDDEKLLGTQIFFLQCHIVWGFESVQQPLNLGF